MIIEIVYNGDYYKTYESELLPRVGERVSISDEVKVTVDEVNHVIRNQFESTVMELGLVILEVS